jgi:hypothetical protein
MPLAELLAPFDHPDWLFEVKAQPSDLAVRRHRADFGAPYFADVAQALGCILTGDREQE